MAGFMKGLKWWGTILVMACHNPPLEKWDGTEAGYSLVALLF